jgi:hypothetical protein
MFTYEGVYHHIEEPLLLTGRETVKTAAKFAVYAATMTAANYSLFLLLSFYILKEKIDPV